MSEAVIQPEAVSSTPNVGLLSTLTLWRREFVRFIRQRSRVVGALGSPIVFWALIGLGLGNSFSPPGSKMPVSYLEYFFPGTLVASSQGRLPEVIPLIDRLIETIDQSPVKDRLAWVRATLGVHYVSGQV